MLKLWCTFALSYWGMKNIAVTRGNTMYLPKAVEEIKEKEGVDESLLRHVSPLGWEHINFIGKYNFDDSSDYNLIDNMIPLREILQ